MEKNSSASQLDSALIVEDDRVIARLLSYWLKQRGFKPRVLHDGKQAIENLKTGELPLVVLLDIIMPFADGFEVLSQLRANENWKKVPVIMLTSKSSEASIVRAFESGADDYVTKPFKPAELMLRMDRLLKKSI
jgi:DNA-binding response OmpR family regulator